MRKLHTNFFLMLGLLIAFGNFSCKQEKKQKQQALQSDSTQFKVQGWNILSRNYDNALKVIDAAKEYDINHLQISHKILMDLRHAKNPETAKMVNDLTEKAHKQGIEEVCVWDHSLYKLDYYPQKFIRKQDGKINLDNPEFWAWLKNDYREMLDLLPDIDGIILTFIETGAHVEDQHSDILKTEEEKLAAMVDTLASVIIDERNLQLYVRTFIYTKHELSSLLKCINLVKNPKLRVMTKEVPHDFFLTHPVSKFVKDIKFPTIIEFDACHEYNGQGIITSILPDVHLKRWNYYSNLPNVIGYVARTDRTKTSTIVGTANEVNLYALYKGVKNPDVDINVVYEQFIEKNYGEKAVEFLKPAFKKAEEIISSIFYTLGLNTNSHSRFQYNDDSAYQRHVSGKWIEPPVIFIEHGVNKEFHYWKDIVNHLAVPWYKGESSGQLAKESRWVLDSNWLKPKELINEEYLKYIVTEKDYGVNQAKEAVELIRKSEDYIQDKTAYDSLYHLFNRTLLTAKLYRGGAKVYFGYRVFARGNEFQTPFVEKTLQEGMEEIKSTAKEMIHYPQKGNQGQFVWIDDAYRALEFYQAVKNRESDDFYKGFFPYFDYFHKARGEFKDEAMKIIEE
ncbi:hypothetical protein GF340_00730 [Candidatus Peregrinibacteria bacterium]|nr:hypothetical protein [Candidatus Peregrinibacteria bacterium]